jgi:hypothetical protein
VDFLDLEENSIFLGLLWQKFSYGKIWLFLVFETCQPRSRLGLQKISKRFDSFNCRLESNGY